MMCLSRLQVQLAVKNMFYVYLWLRKLQFIRVGLKRWGRTGGLKMLILSSLLASRCRHRFRERERSSSHLLVCKARSLLPGLGDAFRERGDRLLLLANFLIEKPPVLLSQLLVLPAQLFVLLFVLVLQGRAAGLVRERRWAGERGSEALTLKTIICSWFSANS